jgi:antigen flippase
MTNDSGGGRPVESRDTSYDEALSSSSIIGGTQAVVYLLSLFKTKIAAVLLGPSGVGLTALYLSATSLLATVSGLGLNTSGVREVASAASTGDERQVAHTVGLLKKLCWLTGVCGWLLTILFAWPLSRWTFGDEEHVWAIAILGSTVMLVAISGGQAAVIQGMRRIGDLAKVNFLCVLGGTTATLVLYALMGQRGIVPALIVSALITAYFSWSFSRRIRVDPVRLPWSDVFSGSRRLLHLGLATMWNALLVTGVALATRALVVREFGLDAAGVYQAAWAISGLFSSFVLSAMVADYYPRLTGASAENSAVNRLVNEQAEVGMLLAVPGLAASLVFAPLAVELLYSSEFRGAIALLPWFIGGVFVQIASWPAGFVPLARGEGAVFAALESVICLSQMVLTVLLLKFYGLPGAGMAFLGAQFIHLAIYFAFARWRTGFLWTVETLKIVLFASFFLGLSFAIFAAGGGWTSYVFGSLIVAAATLFSLRGVAKRATAETKIGKLLAGLPWSQRLLYS